MLFCETYLVTPRVTQPIPHASRASFLYGSRTCTFVTVSMAEAASELADAQALNKTELLTRIESVTLDFIRAVERGDDPKLHLV